MFSVKQDENRLTVSCQTVPMSSSRRGMFGSPTLSVSLTMCCLPLQTGPGAAAQVLPPRGPTDEHELARIGAGKRLEFILLIVHHDVLQKQNQEPQVLVPAALNRASSACTNSF